MVLIDSPLPGCFVFQPSSYRDSRGVFVKTIDVYLREQIGCDFKVKEEFYSLSRMGVIRGMHFQLPPHDHHKLVYCARGAVRDVLLDLRIGEGYGKAAVLDLTEKNRYIVFIAKGVAHGFAACSEDSLVIYKTNSDYVADSDCGVLWNSFGLDWGIENPVISKRDESHVSLKDFLSPFR
jgi:dTDP-4-dehydrorhamnose 3,5-epimerase